VYTGRGKTGDRAPAGPNLDVAENRRTLLVFEAAGLRQLRFLGIATCAGAWPARAPDSSGHDRAVWKFRLAFGAAVQQPQVAVPQQASTPARRARPFDPDAPPPTVAAPPVQRSTPEEAAALREKANQEHYTTVTALARWLTARNWTSVEEIPAAVDLWATPPGRGVRVLFEVKTHSVDNEVSQCRGAAPRNSSNTGSFTGMIRTGTVLC